MVFANADRRERPARRSRGLQLALDRDVVVEPRCERRSMRGAAERAQQRRVVHGVAIGDAGSYSAASAEATTQVRSPFSNGTPAPRSVVSESAPSSSASLSSSRTQIRSPDALRSAGDPTLNLGRLESFERVRQRVQTLAQPLPQGAGSKREGPRQSHARRRRRSRQARSHAGSRREASRARAGCAAPARGDGVPDGRRRRRSPAATLRCGRASHESQRPAWPAAARSSGRRAPPRRSSLRATARAGRRGPRLRPGLLAADRVGQRIRGAAVAVEQRAHRALIAASDPEHERFIGDPARQARHRVRASSVCEGPKGVAAVTAVSAWNVDRIVHAPLAGHRAGVVNSAWAS